MSKTKHKFHADDDGDGVVQTRKPGSNRIKDKRLDRALKTKNIDELIDLDDEGLDPEDVGSPWADPWLDWENFG